MGQSNSKSDSPTKPSLEAKAQWEWKSNPNPFSQSEKDQWTPYKLLDNYLLEKAYYNKQKEVGLGDYIVSINDMLQKRKDNTYRQRPIRRNTEYFKSEEVKKLSEDVRAERFYGAETPKTFNKAFGNLEDYMKFFQNRGPDIREFIALFNDVEIANNVNLLNEIVQPGLVECLQNESKKTPPINSTQKLYEQKLFLLFQETVPSIKQFYANVLKAYTMEGFLYPNLNRYLRNEDWNQLDSLLPYAYCLCKAFLCSELTSNLNNQQSAPSMIVYRGAQFDEVALSFYDPDKVKNFCWNGVTSTSRIRQISENFMYYNFDPKKVPVLFIIEIPMDFENTSKWIDIKPYSAIPNEDEIVLPPGSVFELTKVSRNGNKSVEIELKLLMNVNQLAHHGQIMHGALLSEMSNDTSFRFVCLEARELFDAITHLKGNRLIQELEFDLCKFDEKIINAPLGEIPKLKSLIFLSPFSENKTHWSAILKNLRNAPIEKLEISDDKIDNDQLTLLSQEISALTLLQTLSLSFQRCHQLTKEGLLSLSSNLLSCLPSLTSLHLDLSGCMITDEGLEYLSSQGLKSLISLTFLSLNFVRCGIKDKGLEYLSFQGLKSLISLTSLTLDFQYCEITDQGLNHLSSQGLRFLTSLTSLDLNFMFCSQITDEGLNYLSSQGLQCLTSLKSLTLDFMFCMKITENRLDHLSSQWLKKLTSLTSFKLNFRGTKTTYDGNKISKEYFKQESYRPKGRKNVDCTTFLRKSKNNFDPGNNTYDSAIILNTEKKIEDFRNGKGVLSPCQSVQLEGSLDFVTKAISEINIERGFHDLNLKIMVSQWEEVSDEVLTNLSPQALKNLTSFTSLALHFLFCRKILDENLRDLKFQGLRHFKLLTSLTLTFSFYNTITPRGLTSLGSRGLKHLTSLKSLTLNFLGCKDITDEALNNLSSPSLKQLTSLTSLTLNFPMCLHLTNEGLLNLSSQGLKFLTSLQSLNLNFGCCKQITDDGLLNLASQGIKFLASLTSLDLNFRNCQRITDEGLLHLSSQCLRKLNSLTSLNLNFECCNKITDEGLLNLSSQGLKFLSSLTSLDLNFRYCEQITDEGLKNLSSQGLEPLSSLTSLALHFECCKQITDEGLLNLRSQGLKFLTSLTSLGLNFRYSCITDEGLGNLSSQGLRFLTSLTSLNLNFRYCEQITDEGLNKLSFQGLKYLTSLTSLTLTFESCKKITDEGMENLGSQGLKHLISLTSLTLYFGFNDKITGKGLDHLSSQGIKYLTSLKSLNLDFHYCRSLTNEGLMGLISQGLKYLTSLTCLTFDFFMCTSINFEAWRNFCKILKYFGYEIF